MKGMESSGYACSGNRLVKYGIGTRNDQLFNFQVMERHGAYHLGFCDDLILMLEAFVFVSDLFVDKFYVLRGTFYLRYLRDLV